MSIQAVGWVLDHSASRGVDRLVLISLANHANADDECWPAQRTIAREAGIANGTVSNALSRLVTLGEIEVRRPGTSRTSTRYRILRLSSSGERSGGERRAHPEMSAALTPGMDRSLKNHHEEVTDSAHVEDFSALANPKCLGCGGRGSRYHAGAGREARCECTKPLVKIRDG